MLVLGCERTVEPPPPTPVPPPLEPAKRKIEHVVEGMPTYVAVDAKTVIELTDQTTSAELEAAIVRALPAAKTSTSRIEFADGGSEPFVVNAVLSAIERRGYRDANVKFRRPGDPYNDEYE